MLHEAQTNYPQILRKLIYLGLPPFESYALVDGHAQCGGPLDIPRNESEHRGACSRYSPLFSRAASLRGTLPARIATKARAYARFGPFKKANIYDCKQVLPGKGDNKLFLSRRWIMSQTNGDGGSHAASERPQTRIALDSKIIASMFTNRKNLGS